MPDELDPLATLRGRRALRVEDHVVGYRLDTRTRDIGGVSAEIPFLVFDLRGRRTPCSVFDSRVTHPYGV